MAIKDSLPTRSRLVHLVKYASVSVIASVTSLTVLGVLVGVFGWSSVWSNVVATAVGTIPSFELNRRWVWSQHGKRSHIAQVLPFCLLSFGGLLISTLAVRLAGNATLTSGRLLHTGAVELANVGSYGVLWIGQFILCEKVLFKTQSPNGSTDPVAVAASFESDQESADRALCAVGPR